MKRTFALALIMAVQPCLAGITVVDSDLTISSGDTFEGIDVVDSPPHRTTVTVLGGAVNSLRMQDSSVANIYAGSIFSLGAIDQGTLNLFGLDYSGAIGAAGSSQINIYGNVPETVLAGQSASLRMYSGSQVPSVQVHNSAHGALYGGLVQDILSAHDSGDLRLYGGEVGNYLIADGNSTVEFHGYGFTYDPAGGNVGMGLIEGYWLDGTPLSISLATVPGAPDDTYSHITFVPEPATLMQLALSSLVLRRRRPHSEGAPSPFRTPKTE